MNKKEQSLYYFAFGEFIARIMLQGIIHPDMQHCNIGFSDGNFKFADYADAHKISMPEDLTAVTIQQLTESLFSAIDDIPDDFTIRSHFRAGFTSYGGVLTHTIFSNAVNSGFSSFLYSNESTIDAVYDASFLYTDKSLASAINEWKTTPLDRIALKNFTGLTAYNDSTERHCISHFNIHYLDNLYFVRSYLGLNQIKEVASQMPILILNMAVSTHQYGLFYTAYGLYQKCLLMKSTIAEVNSTCIAGLKELIDTTNSNVEITDFISNCLHYDLFELMWILNDLENPLPHDIHFEPKDDDDYGTNFIPNIAPELMGDPLYVITSAQLGIEDDGDAFSEYLENTQEKYQNIKTLLYSDAPKPFYDFYVCNTLTYKVSRGRNSYVTETIRDVTADILSDCTNFVIITGTGGLGKSMMMRHLLLDCIEQYPIIEKLPIFIPLKDFDDSYDDLTDYIYEKFDALGGGIDLEEFEDVLSEGRCLLLFDGLDEVHSSVRKLFEKKLDIFADKYSDNIFVISSRPAMSFVAFNRFTVFELKPFDKLQALELIDKLEFRTDEPTIKAAFRKKLDEDLFYTHREFAENPLLLTIMLMTFEQFAEVPSKMHIFYREAYLTLSQKHDATKGAYKRALSTGVTADRFSEYFAEFCARTYYDEKFDFTDEDFERYYTGMAEPKKDRNTASTTDFITDLVVILSISLYTFRSNFLDKSKVMV